MIAASSPESAERYRQAFGFARADWPNIDAWLDRIAALPGWKHPYDLMPGSPADRA